MYQLHAPTYIHLIFLEGSTTPTAPNQSDTGMLQQNNSKTTHEAVSHDGTTQEECSPSGSMDDGYSTLQNKSSEQSPSYEDGTTGLEWDQYMGRLGTQKTPLSPQNYGERREVFWCRFLKGWTTFSVFHVGVPTFCLAFSCLMTFDFTPFLGRQPCQ